MPCTIFAKSMLGSSIVVPIGPVMPRVWRPTPGVVFPVIRAVVVHQREQRMR
jgi:hypothetical protein